MATKGARPCDAVSNKHRIWKLTNKWSFSSFFTNTNKQNNNHWLGRVHLKNICAPLFTFNILLLMDTNIQCIAFTMNNTARATWITILTNLEHPGFHFRFHWLRYRNPQPRVVLTATLTKTDYIFIYIHMIQTSPNKSAWRVPYHLGHLGSSTSIFKEVFWGLTGLERQYFS